MSSRGNSSRFGRRAVGAAWLLLFAWSLLDSEARADSLPGGGIWQPGVKISAASHIEFTRGRSASFSTIGAQFSLERSLPESPFSSGVFADIELTSQDSGSRLDLIGGWTTYGRERWQFATSTAYFQADQRGGMWIHANTIQYEPRSGHKFAIAAIGVFGSSRAPATQLIYKTTLGHVAIALNLGIGGTRPQDFGASTKIVWNLY